MSNNRGRLFVISGPSGSGKSSVCGEVSRITGIPCSISATTRAPRNGERDGVHYFFLTPEQFQERVDQDRFYEHAEVFGNRYGTPREPIEEALESGDARLLEVDIQGARSVRRRCDRAVLIFIAAPDDDELRARLQKRGTESDEVISRRLARSAEENTARDEYDYVVVNDSLAEAIEEVTRIVETERSNG